MPAGCKAELVRAMFRCCLFSVKNEEQTPIWFVNGVRNNL